MHFIDLEEYENNSSFQTDLCIIGSGPSGMSIAKEFAQSNIKVMIVESGGLSSEEDVQKLYEIESIGDPRRLDQTNLRRRIFGGSSHIWTGRCSPFANIDYETRDWIPHSGWPITEADIEPFFEKASVNLGINPDRYDDSLWEKFKVKIPTPKLNSEKLNSQFWQFSKGSNTASKAANFGRDIDLSHADNIQVLLHANVKNINVNEGSNKFSDIEVSTLTSITATVKAKILVVACGGVENARLLLASNKQISEGLGNQHDNVGRYLMDHTLYVLGDFDANNSDLVRKRFGHYWLDNSGKRHVYLHGLTLSNNLQKSEKLLGCHAFIEEYDKDENNPMDVIKRLINKAMSMKIDKSLFKDTYITFMNSAYLLKSLYRRFIEHRPSLNKANRVELHVMMEQVPDPDSRIKLSKTKVDALGMPISEIDWKINDLEKKTFTRMHTLLCEEFNRIGLPAPSLFNHFKADGDNWKQFSSEKAHPTGTTRMSDDPKKGVVDKNLKVHGIDNLFVVGSSVFPTSSAVNPTFMIVSISLRLASHLKENYFK